MYQVFNNNNTRFQKKKFQSFSSNLESKIDWLIQPRIEKKFRSVTLLSGIQIQRISQDSCCWTDDFQSKLLPFYIKWAFIWIVLEQQGRVCLRQYPLTFRVSWFQVQDFRAFKCQSRNRGSQPSLFSRIGFTFFRVTNTVTYLYVQVASFVKSTC